MTKPVIAIDIDDVLIPHESLLVAQYKKHIDAAYPHSDMYSFDLTAQSEKVRARVVQVMTNYIASEEFFTVAPVKEAGAALVLLKQAYRLVIVSVRADFMVDRTKRWLEQHFPKTFEDTRFVQVAEWGQGPKQSKLNLLQELGVSVLIDDNLRHATMAAAEGIKVLLFGDYPWNKTDNLPKDIIRVRDWDEVVKVLGQ